MRVTHFQPENGVHLKTILNRVDHHPGFVYSRFQIAERVPRMTVNPRKGSRPVCSRCGLRQPGYDSLPQRRFEFSPLWGILVFFLAMRRVDCARCGVTVERVPWANGKSSLTKAYALWRRPNPNAGQLAAKTLTIQEVGGLCARFYPEGAL